MQLSLSRARRKVISYAQVHSQEVSYLTAKELGNRCGVSESTVIRAVQALGFSGYPEFQNQIRAKLARKKTTIERLAGSKKDNPLSWAFAKDLKNLRTTMEQIPPETFARAVKLLANATRLWILGLRMAHSVAVIQYFGLRFLGIDARLLTPSLGDIWDEITIIKSKDVLLVTSLPRHTRLAMEVARLVSDRGVTIIALTDGPLSPLADLAECLFPIAYDLNGYIESFTSAIALSQALLLGVAEQRGSECLVSLKKKEKLWAKQGVYWIDGENKNSR